MSNLWLLPDGIEELLPEEAWQLEKLRRSLVDLCYHHGYELVSPSLLEHLDSLLSGGGEDLELQTFKLIDHASGRQLGIRADMTPQIARIDAHLLNAAGPSRLCYAGPVLRARRNQAFENRELFQVGAELYGAEGAAADIEIIELMLSCLDRCGLGSLHVDLGHVGVFRAISRECELDRVSEARLFEALQRKSVPDLTELVGEIGLPENMAEAIVNLPGLGGDMTELSDAADGLKGLCAEIAPSLDALSEIMQQVVDRNPQVEVRFDLSELRGYHYHTGVVFSAFCDGHGREIARGGRYDSIGAVYGRSRPATGFSLDLRQILKLREPSRDTGYGILAPEISNDPELERTIDELRQSGQRVLRRLESSIPQTTIPECDRQLVKQGDSWVVIKL